MMIWCHLHKELGKVGVTNFEMTEYEADYDWLVSVTQEQLIERLRSEGRRQAATRQLRAKQPAPTAGLPATQFQEQAQLQASSRAGPSPGRRTGSRRQGVKAEAEADVPLSTGEPLPFFVAAAAERAGTPEAAAANDEPLASTMPAQPEPNSDPTALPVTPALPEITMAAPFGSLVFLSAPDSAPHG